MRKIDFAEPGTPEWAAWRASCESAACAIVEQLECGQKPDIVDALYKDQKQFYADISGPFGGRCAYCERVIVSDQYGDMEHYRPKGGVQDEDWSVVEREQGGEKVKHPGYRWLAYDWKNLLFACVSCNRPSIGRQFGKWNRFPVDGQRAWAPGEEADEQPVLLNPCVDDPAEHMTFDSLTGRLVGTSDRGRRTIAILGLNDRSLPALRQKAYRDFEMKFRAIMMKHDDDWPDQLIEARDEILTDFPSVVLRSFDDQKQSYMRGLEALQ